MGKIVKDTPRPRTPAEDPLMQVFRETQQAAEAEGLTEAEIDAELAAYNAERRDRR